MKKTTNLTKFILLCSIVLTLCIGESLVAGWGGYGYGRGGYGYGRGGYGDGYYDDGYYDDGYYDDGYYDDGYYDDGYYDDGGAAIGLGIGGALALTGAAIAASDDGDDHDRRKYQDLEEQKADQESD